MSEVKENELKNKYLILKDLYKESKFSHEQGFMIPEESKLIFSEHKSKLEFTINNGKKEYHIMFIKLNTSNNILHLTNLFKSYNDKSGLTYMAIDFEFDNNKNATLCQINFEDNNSAYIIVFDPFILCAGFNTSKQFINLLINKNIIKIMQGANSLDLQYIYNKILNKNNDIFDNFIKNLVDMLYICELYKRFDKCSIKYALHNYKIISDAIQERYTMLTSATHKMFMNNNLYKLNRLNFDKFINDDRIKNIYEYAYYDVIYLVEYFKFFDLKAPNIYINNESDDNIIYNIFFSISRLNFQEFTINNKNLYVQITNAFGFTKIPDKFIVIKNNKYCELKKIIRGFIEMSDNVIKLIYQIDNFKSIINNILLFYIYYYMSDQNVKINNMVYALKNDLYESKTYDQLLDLLDSIFEDTKTRVIFKELLEESKLKSYIGEFLKNNDNFKKPV
jgi:hypothetical protein